MGIVNVTEDSFSDGGDYLAPEKAIAHARSLVAAGADIIDVGGESTRPGAHRIPRDIERARIEPVVAFLAGEGISVSIDTMNAETAAAACRAGARIVNDVSGGQADPAMLPAVAAAGAEIVLGHWRGPSDDMYARAHYDDVVSEVMAELHERVDAARAAGIAPERIIVDPGIGFGKRGEDNWSVLRQLERIATLGYRVLVGASRKRFLQDALATDDIARRDLATAVTSVLAAQEHAWGVRVHDVQATVDALTIASAWKGSA